MRDHELCGRLVVPLVRSCVDVFLGARARNDEVVVVATVKLLGIAEIGWMGCRNEVVLRSSFFVLSSWPS
jgi:hypothetical protein